MRLTFLMLTVITFICTATAFAAGDAHGGGNQWVDLVWRVVNFLIFAAILYFAAAKPVRHMLRGRIDGIRQDLENAEAAKKNAEEKLEDCLKKIENLEAEIDEIHSTLKKEGEVERDRIIEAAEAAAEKIKVQASFSADQEAKKAIISIREEVATAAVAMAEKVISKELTKDDHKRLVAECLDGMGGAN